MFHPEWNEGSYHLYDSISATHHSCELKRLVLISVYPRNQR